MTRKLKLICVSEAIQQYTGELLPENLNINYNGLNIVTLQKIHRIKRLFFLQIQEIQSALRSWHCSQTPWSQEQEDNSSFEESSPDTMSQYLR